MLIVRKRTVTRFLSLLFGAVLLVVGLFFQRQAIKKESENNRTNHLASFYTSVCVSLDNICASIDEVFLFNNKNNATRTIYSNCNTIKNSIYFCNVDMPNTVSWVSSLAEYSETDMSNPELNDYYSKTASQASSLFVSLCSNVDDTSKIDSIETLLDKRDSAYYSKKLQKLNNDYLLLNNLLEADRKEINERAKKILNYPFFPQKTKGIFSDPQSFLYSTKNSYAQIFSAGGSLKRMSIQETSPVNHIPENELEELSVKYLAEYAPYAKKCKNIYTHKNTELVYYVYCPVIQQGKNSFVDVTEPIKLAISISDGKLMAFDASHYMKTHSEKEYPEFPNIKQERTLSVPENLSPESSGYIYSKKGLLYCTKYKTNENKIVYRTVDANNDSAIYDERSFMLVSGII